RLVDVVLVDSDRLDGLSRGAAGRVAGCEHAVSRARAATSATAGDAAPRAAGSEPMSAPAVAQDQGVVGAATPPRALLRTAGAYFALTKPRIIELLLTTTLPAMVLAAKG